VNGAGMQDLLPRRFRWADLTPALMTVAAMAMGAVIHIFFMVPYASQAGYDEGYEAAAVERIISGQWLPYVDAVSQRGPFLYWTQAIFHLISGRYQWTGTRLLSLVAFLVTTGATFLTGWGAGWPLAGAIGAVTYALVIATIYEPGGGIGVHGEPVAIAYLMIATALVAYALYRTPAGRRRTILLATGGVLVGVAGMTKQTLAVACGPMFIWIFARIGGVSTAGSPDAPTPLRAGFRQGVLPFALGGLGLIALLLVRYAVAGHLGTFFYWSVTFNTQVYMEPFKGRVFDVTTNWFLDQPWSLVGVAVALAIAIGRPVSFVERPSVRGILAGLRSGGFEMTVGLTAVALLITGVTPLRLWPHYFVPIFPFFGLALGVAIERLVHRGGTVNLAAQIVVGLAVVGMLLATGERRYSRLTTQRSHGSYINPRPDPACRELNRIDGGGRQPVFMWGVLGDLYITCRRPSVSKFTYTTVVAGIVPPFWDDKKDSRVPAGVRETLLQELTTAAPTVIMDHPMGARAAMMDFPVFASFVNQRYCHASTLSDLHGRSINFYARRDLPACKGK
jgi:hypothetical protein